MAVKVPFQYLDGVAEPARTQLWRDFEEIQRALHGVIAAPFPGTMGTALADGLELYQPASTPYIDFHRAANPAGDGNADYNVRLINDAAGRLSLVGGNLWAQVAYIGTHPIHNTWAAFGHVDRLGVNSYGFMQESTGRTLINSDWDVRIALDGTEKWVFDDNGLHTYLKLNLTDQPIRFRQWNDGNHGAQYASGGWGGSGTVDGPAMWGHSGVLLGSHYGGTPKWQLHIRDGSATFRGVGHFNENNEVRDDIIKLGAWGDYVLGVRSETLYLRTYRSLHLDSQKYGALRLMEVNRDGNSGLWIGVGWFRVNDGDNGLYNHPRAQGIQFTAEGFRTYPNGNRIDAYLFDHLGAWPNVPLFIRSDGGGSGARVCHRAAGQNAAPLWKAWGQAFEARSWDDGGMIPIRGVIENYCRGESKSNIRAAAERLPKAQRKQKVKALRTVHYNREKRGQGCANCLGTGEATRNERIKSALEMKKAHEKDDRPDKDHRAKKALPREVADVAEPAEGEPCPDCGGQGMTWERPENIRAEEAGWFGFVAEEIVEQFPEAMFYRQDEDGEVRVSGADHMALIAILWEEVKDLEERLDGVEKIPAVALGKKK